jgi:hypothetical protein
MILYAIKYKPGDKVRVRFFEDLQTKYSSDPRTSCLLIPAETDRNSIQFLGSMTLLCGKIVTISNVIPQDSHKKKYDRYYVVEDDNDSYWSDAMFISPEEEATLQIKQEIGLV